MYWYVSALVLWWQHGGATHHFRYCQVLWIQNCLKNADIDRWKAKKSKKKYNDNLWIIPVHKCKRMCTKLFLMHKMSISFVFNSIKKMKFKWLTFFVWIDSHYSYGTYAWIGALLQSRCFQQQGCFNDRETNDDEIPDFLCGLWKAWRRLQR